MTDRAELEEACRFLRANYGRHGGMREDARTAGAKRGTEGPNGLTRRDARQKSVAEWCAAAFGADAANSLPQRGVRLLEEAVELYQAAGCDAAMAHKLVDFVFARPVGKLAKEIGQVGLVLLSMAEAAGVSADDEEAKEVARVNEKPLLHYAARNRAKNAAGFDTAHEAVEPSKARDQIAPPPTLPPE